MVPIALAFLFGILAGDFIALPLPGLFVLATVAMALAAFAPRGRAGWLLLALFLTGWLDIAVRQAVLSPHDLRHHAGEEPRLVTVRGRILHPPSTRVTERDDKTLWRTLAVLRVEGWRLEETWEPAAGEVAITTQGDLSTNLFTGLRVEVTGVLQAPPKAAVPGGFDYRQHLARQGIHFQLIAEGLHDWQIPPGQSQSWLRSVGERFSNWARANLANGLPVEDEPLRLLWAMTLGWRAALTGEVSEPFMRSGTMHIFAISGLHVALIAAILVQLLRLAGVPRGACGLIAIPLLWFYAGATGWQSSAVRSTIMATVVIAGWSLHRPGNLLNSLAGAAFLILAWEPQQLFMASFQLSFAVVLSIALLLPHFERVRNAWFQPDPLLPPELRPRWQRWLDAPVRFLTMSFATSLAAWLGSLPLVASYFHLFTPVGLLANLLIVPLSGLALMSCCGSLLTGALVPPVAELFNHSAWFWMSLMQRASGWCAELPGAWFPVGTPTPAMFVLYYVMLVCVVTGAVFRKANWKWIGPVLLLPGLVVVAQWQQAQNVTRLHALGLRGGEALYLEAPGRANDWLIDCATTSDVEFALKPFLRSRGVKQLAHLALTHGDHRHVEGFALVDEQFRPAEVVTSGLRFRSPGYRLAEQALEATPARRQIAHRGDQLGPWTVLHPAMGDRFSQADDGALVLRTEIAGFRVLLLSDLGREGQQALLASGQDLRADILLAGVPVQGEPLRAELLEVIQPRLILITAAAMPANERPTPALRERLATGTAKVLYTLDTGALTLKFANGQCDVSRVDGTVLTALKARSRE